MSAGILHTVFPFTPVLLAAALFELKIPFLCLSLFFIYFWILPTPTDCLPVACILPEGTISLAALALKEPTQFFHPQGQHRVKDVTCSQITILYCLEKQTNQISCDAIDSIYTGNCSTTNSRPTHHNKLLLNSIMDSISFFT